MGWVLREKKGGPLTRPRPTMPRMPRPPAKADPRSILRPPKPPAPAGYEWVWADTKRTRRRT